GLAWPLEGSGREVSYRRQIRNSPDGGYTLAEVWQCHPDDLAALCRFWGHPDTVTWEGLRGELPHGRIVVDARQGKLLIIRDVPAEIKVWREPPFALDLLPTERYPNLPFDEAVTASDRDETEPSRSASFLADLVNEELLDRDGVPVSLSQT